MRPVLITIMLCVRRKKHSQAYKQEKGQRDQRGPDFATFPGQRNEQCESGKGTEMKKRKQWGGKWRCQRFKGDHPCLVPGRKGGNWRCALACVDKAMVPVAFPQRQGQRQGKAGHDKHDKRGGDARPSGQLI